MALDERQVFNRALAAEITTGDHDAGAVRIIHGKGTGKLRQAVREALKGHAYVKSFEEGAHTEGGEGVTVAKLNAG